MKKLCLVLALLTIATVFTPVDAEASHFRFGILTQRPGANPGEVIFNMQVAFRRSAFPFGAGTAVGQTFNPGANLNFGDTSSTNIGSFVVTSENNAEDWIIGVMVSEKSHTYTGTGPFTASWGSCCRIGALSNRSNGSWRLETIVRPFSGNTSPSTSLNPIVTVVKGAASTFQVPASDFDGDPIRFRLSTNAEAGGGSGPSNISIHPTTGIVTWNTSTLSVGAQYTVQVVTEDLDANGGVKSKTPVDFIMKIAEQTTNTPPFFTDPTCNSTITGIVGQALAINISANDNDANDPVTLNAVGVPSGGSLSAVSGQPATGTFTWTPANSGNTVVTFTATDGQPLTTNCSVTISVGAAVPSPPPFTFNVPLPDPATLLCLPPYMIEDPNAAQTHVWWARSTGEALLNVTVVGLSVNGAEAGILDAALVPPSGTAVTGSTLQPTTPGLENPFLLSIPGGSDGDLFRIELNVSALTGNPLIARHYRIEVEGASLLGGNSPLQTQAEHHNARWGVNAVVGENVSVDVISGPTAGATTGNSALRNEVGTLITPGLVPGTLTATAATAGQWTLGLKNLDGHYVVDKTSGSDQGVYVNWTSWGESTVSGAITINGSPNTLLMTLKIKNPYGQVVFNNSVTGTFSKDHLLPGPYTVELITPRGTETHTVLLSCGVDGVADFNILNSAPSVTLLGESMDEADGPITLAATVTDADGDAPLTYTWTHVQGNGTLTGSAGATASFNSTDGPSIPINKVELTVSDGFPGGSTSVTVDVDVLNVAPTANAGPDQFEFWGLDVNFAGSGSDQSPDDVLAGLNPTWTFGDGSPSATGFTASHPYDAPGPYTATLTVTDKDLASGSGSALVTVNKRGTSISYTGDTTAPFGFGSTLSAQLSDDVDTPTALLEGRTITFTVDGNTIVATTDTNGVATAPAPALLLPGTYTVKVDFSGDSHYLASSDDEGELTITNSAGKVTAGTLRTPNRGRGGFNVQSNGGADVKGELQFQNSGINFHAHTITALSVSPDRTQAWFAGIGRTGQPFVAYVEDNGEPGRNDIFRLWIAGVPQNGGGNLTGGNVQIHKK